MSAMPVGWHEGNLKNFENYLERKQNELIELEKEVKDMHIEAAFRRHQIATAKAKGKESFDGERYLAKDKIEVNE